MTLDYGNARIAARRGRLLDRGAIARLAESRTPAAMLASLERLEDWQPIVRGVAPLGTDPSTAIDAAIDRHRSARLAPLPSWFPEGTQRLVEALVLPLDLERVLSVLRRRRAGETHETVVAAVVAGALLDAAALAGIARAPSPRAALEVVAAHGVIDRQDVPPLDAAASGVGSGADPEPFERALVAAVERGRWQRAAGRGADASRVRALLEREEADRRAVGQALEDGGAATAAVVERALTLGRLDALARAGRREPLGIGTAIGYVAAVESGAIRLRAALARVRAGGRAEQLAPWFASEGGGRWPAWWS